MLADLLLPDAAGLHLERIETEDETIVLEVRSTASEAACPKCGQVSTRVHSKYLRHPRDLPWATVPVRLRLHARRFRCLTDDCVQRIFVERFPTVTKPSSRHTVRLEQVLAAVALALGGEAGARLSPKLRLSTSPTTLLRLARRAPLPSVPSSRAIGIDEWAFRKGRRYGAIIVDLETHQVVDLLPDDTSASMANWLRAHPGVKVIARDRAGPFATAATETAPQAIQVADRFHLLQNLGDVLKRVLQRHARQIDPVRYPVVDSMLAADVAAATTDKMDSLAVESMSIAPHADEVRPTDVQIVRDQRRQQRQAQYDEARRLKQIGLNHWQIARKLGISRKTVIRWLNASDYLDHPGGKLRGRPLGSKLDPYKSYLEQRFQEGCETASVLWREIQAQGFEGSASLVRKFITPLRHTSTIPTIAQVKREPQYSVPDLVFFVLRRPADRTDEQQLIVAKLRQVDETIKIACDLTETFVVMVRERQHEKFDAWLDQAETSGLPEFRTFVRGLRRDVSAVRNGLSLSWSNGATEGQIHRLKLVKRSMYGRANFDLLKQRVLLAA